jgi:hypothetical protein
LREWAVGRMAIVDVRLKLLARCRLDPRCAVWL